MSGALQTAYQNLRSFVVADNDAYFMYNSLLLPGNGTNNANNKSFLDSSTNAFTVTRVGNPTQGTFNPYGANWSNYFDGTGDYLRVPYNAGFAMGSSNFTIEYWVYPTVLTGDITVLGAHTNDANGGYGVGFNGTQARSWINIGVSWYQVTGPTVLLNTWNHIALVRNGSNFYMYVNGVQGTVYTNGGAIYDVSNSDVTIGARYNGTGNFYTGYVTDARIVKGTAVYTDTFTPPTAPLTAISGTSLLTCQSNRFKDNSTNAFVITKYGDTSVQRFSPFSPSSPGYTSAVYGGSGYFDGTGDWLTFTGATTGSGSFTTEAWVYLFTLKDYQLIFDNRATGLTVTGYAFGVDAAGKPYIYTNGAFQILSSIVITSNTWNHIALVRNGTTITLYVNGVSGGSYTSSANFSDTNNGIGVAPTYTPSSQYSGYISNFRVVNGTAVYTAAFTPPTAPVTAISNTSLLLNMTSAGIIDNSMINDLETVGDAKISTAQSKFGGSSIYFDGTGNYLVMPNTPNLSFGSGNFTIECWVYANSLGSYNALVAQWPDNGGTTNNSYVLEAVSPDMSFYWVSGATLYGPATLGTITTGVWTHYAICRSGNTLYPFKNGVLGTTVAISQTLNSPTSAVTVGGQVAGGGGWHGYMDDLRITKGYARYTANFTPPTSAFPTF